MYQEKREVRHQDVDAAGVVFFTRLLEYCHDAYFNYLEALGVDLPLALEKTHYILPVIHADADYESDLHFGDQINVAINKIEHTADHYTVHYQIFKDDAAHSLCCVTKIVHAAFFKEDFARIKKLPKEVVQALQLEPRPL